MSVMEQRLQLGYFKHIVNGKFITKPLFYLLYKPMQMSKYEELKAEVRAKNIPVNFMIGMLEKAVMFGNGWIGLHSEQYGTKEIAEEFYAYKITGDYNLIGPAYKKVMKDYPQAKEYYNLYLTDPTTTPADQNITYILFK